MRRTAAGARDLVPAQPDARLAPFSPGFSWMSTTDGRDERGDIRPGSGDARASDAEAIAHINDSPFGLTASVWSSDSAAAHSMSAALDVGTVFLNRCDYLDPALAWVGVKASGRGTTLSSIGYDALTRPQSLHFRLRD